MIKQDRFTLIQNLGWFLKSVRISQDALTDTVGDKLFQFVERVNGFIFF